jgi:hypothetical protein
VAAAGAFPVAVAPGGDAARAPAAPLDLETGGGGPREPGAPAPPLLPLETIPYTDRVRGRIAERLIWLLCGVVLFAFASLWRIEPPPAAADLKELLTVLFGPLVALVAAAVGYYFGGKAT